MLSVAVFICFLICWTPHHVARIRFLIITKSQSWDEKSTSIQETIHIVAGKYYYNFHIILTQYKEQNLFDYFILILIISF